MMSHQRVAVQGSLTDTSIRKLQATANSATQPARNQSNSAAQRRSSRGRSTTESRSSTAAKSQSQSSQQQAPTNTNQAVRRVFKREGLSQGQPVSIKQTASARLTTAVKGEVVSVGRQEERKVAYSSRS